MSTPLPPYPNIPPQHAPYNMPPQYLQQGFQPIPPPVFKPLPPKKSRTGLVVGVVGGVFALGIIGILANPGSKQGVQAGIDVVRTSAPAAVVSTVAAPPPAPATTVVTVTAGPTLSTNSRLLRLAWTSMSASDQAQLKASWLKFKDNPAYSDLFVDTFLDTMRTSAPSLTRAEVIDFFRWVETQ